MNRQELLDWYHKYDEEEDQWSPELEKRLGDKFRARKEMAKDELIEIVKWKFATNPHRLKRELNLIQQVDDTEIRRLSKLAFTTDNETAKILYLGQIKGIGLALASTILTFLDPKNYGIFDIHIYDEVFGTNPQTRPKDMSNDPQLYLELLNKLRKIAKENDVDVRVVEKALFKKNYDESNKR